jgi:hypothetical protein
LTYCYNGNPLVQVQVSTYGNTANKQTKMKERRKIHIQHSVTGFLAEGSVQWQVLQMDIEF